MAAKRRTSTAGKRNIRKRKKRKSPILFILKFLIVTGALYAVMFHTPALEVTEVYVTGNVNVEQSLIISASELKAGDNLLKIRYREVCEKIQKIPYVSVAEIKYKFPNKLNINVTEGEIMVTFDTDYGFVSVDKNLKILEINENSEKFPIIYGINFEKNVLGEKITIDESQKFDIILLYREIFESKNLLDVCKQMTLENGELTAEFEGGLKVKCGGREDAEYKISAFKAALESNPEVTIGTFDVRDPQRVVYKIE